MVTVALSTPLYIPPVLLAEATQLLAKVQLVTMACDEMLCIAAPPAVDLLAINNTCVKLGFLVLKLFAFSFKTADPLEVQVLPSKITLV